MDSILHLKTTPWLVVGCCCPFAALFQFFQHPAEGKYFNVQTFLSVEHDWEDQQYNWSIGGSIYQCITICSRVQIS